VVRFFFSIISGLLAYKRVAMRVLMLAAGGG
jgi:hypothetical protein